MSERRRSRCVQLVDDVGKEKILEIERGSTRSHLLMNWLWAGCEDRGRND